MTFHRVLRDHGILRQDKGSNEPKQDLLVILLPHQELDEGFTSTQKSQNDLIKLWACKVLGYFHFSSTWACGWMYTCKASWPNEMILLYVEKEQNLWLPLRGPLPTKEWSLNIGTLNQTALAESSGACMKAFHSSMTLLFRCGNTPFRCENPLERILEFEWLWLLVATRSIFF